MTRIKRSAEYVSGYNAGYHARLYQVRRRASTTRRVAVAVAQASTSSYERCPWVCLTCGNTGIILRHSSDSDVKAIWRRQQSHGAQIRKDHCPGTSVLWRRPAPTGGQS